MHTAAPMRFDKRALRGSPPWAGGRWQRGARAIDGASDVQRPRDAVPRHRDSNQPAMLPAINQPCNHPQRAPSLHCRRLLRAINGATWLSGRTSMSIDCVRLARANQRHQHHTRLEAPSGSCTTRSAPSRSTGLVVATTHAPAGPQRSSCYYFSCSNFTAGPCCERAELANRCPVAPGYPLHHARVFAREPSRDALLVDCINNGQRDALDALALPCNRPKLTAGNLAAASTHRMLPPLLFLRIV